MTELLKKRKKRKSAAPHFTLAGLRMYCKSSEYIQFIGKALLLGLVASGFSSKMWTNFIFSQR